MGVSLEVGMAASKVVCIRVALMGAIRGGMEVKLDFSLVAIKELHIKAATGVSLGFHISIREVSLVRGVMVGRLEFPNRGVSVLSLEVRIREVMGEVMGVSLEFNIRVPLVTNQTLVSHLNILYESCF